MNINVLDFEEILKNFTPYHESLKSIQKYKQDFSDIIKDIKTEMESIANGSKSLILDNSTIQKSEIRFKELQTKALQAESEFRATINIKQNEEIDLNFKQINKIVDSYSVLNNIDLVINKNSVVYNTEKIDITLNIIEEIKKIGLYNEYKENSYNLA